MLNINLRHLFSLTAIAETGRISAAAERAHLSQSALTQALRKIEITAGAALFDRAGGGVTPTDAGRLLINRSTRASALLARAEREIRQRETTGAVHGGSHRPITASQLRALIAVVKTGGYSLAARELDLAQPTVYRAAKDLEARIGVALFRRSAKGVDTRKPGRLLARYAELAFAEIRQGFEEVSELRGNMMSRVAVGCLPLARAELLPKAIDQLLNIYPDAKVSILDGPYGEQLHALRCGQIDWIVGALRCPPPTTDIVQRQLFEEPLSIVVRSRHPLLDKLAPDAATLANLEWIAPAKHTPTRDLFESFFARDGVATPRRIIECNSLAATRGLLQHSNRAALLSPVQIRGDLVTNKLAVLGQPLPGTRRPIGITVRADWEPTSVQFKFSEILAASA